MLCVCVGDVMDVVFSVCIVRRGAVGSHECLLLFTPSCCSECFYDLYRCVCVY